MRPQSAGAAQPSGPVLQVAALGQARRPSRGGSVGGPRRCHVAGHLEQMRADRVEAMVLGEPLVAVEGREEVKPARGPCTIATATAWLRVTMGLGVKRSSSVYSATICFQSVSSARAASAWTAAIAACSW